MPVDYRFSSQSGKNEGETHNGKVSKVDIGDSSDTAAGIPGRMQLWQGRSGKGS
jgi:hypothetical protein